MALGDRNTVQNTINTSYGNSQDYLNKLRTQQEQNYSNFYNNYQTATNNNLSSYNNIMKNYEQFKNPGFGAGNPSTLSNPVNQEYGNLSDPTAWMGLVQDNNKLAQWVKANYPNMSDADVQYYVSHIQEKPGANPTEQAGSANYWLGRMPEAASVGGGSDPFYGGVMNSLKGYQNFAETGGFSPQDVQDMRSQMLAPIRAVYANALDNTMRASRLQHGTSPNTPAALAKMAREQSYAQSDATTNANAAIAQMIQSGKLAGLGGLSQTGLAGRGQNLQSLQGETSLYAATPGQMQTTGNQLLGASGQNIDVQKLQQLIDQGKVEAQLQQAGMPSNFDQVTGRIAQLLGLGTQGATAASNWKKILGFLIPGGGTPGNDVYFPSNNGSFIDFSNPESGYIYNGPGAGSAPPFWPSTYGPTDPSKE